MRQSPAPHLWGCQEPSPGGASLSSTLTPAFHRAWATLPSPARYSVPAAGGGACSGSRPPSLGAPRKPPPESRRGPGLGWSREETALGRAPALGQRSGLRRLLGLCQEPARPRCAADVPASGRAAPVAGCRDAALVQQGAASGGWSPRPPPEVGRGEGGAPRDTGAEGTRTHRPGPPASPCPDRAPGWLQAKGPSGAAQGVGGQPGPAPERPGGRKEGPSDALKEPQHLTRAQNRAAAPGTLGRAGPREVGTKAPAPGKLIRDALSPPSQR